MAEVRMPEVNCPAGTSAVGNVAESGARLRTLAPLFSNFQDKVKPRQGTNSETTSKPTATATAADKSFRSTLLLLLIVFLLFLFDLQVVGDGEDAGDLVGLHAGDLLVHGAGDYALERDITVFHDDMNGRNCAHLVLTENAVAIDGPIHGAADVVVVD